MKKTRIPLLLVLIALLAPLLSFVKFEHCRSTGWATPDVYVHGCYSDLSALFAERGIDHHSWPYSSDKNAVEYPPLTGLVMWATSWLVPKTGNRFVAYFDVNAVFIAILFFLLCLLLAKARPEYRYLLTFSPAVIASLYINWDLWAVLPAVGALYLREKSMESSTGQRLRIRNDLSAVLLGIAVATKFYPIVLLLPILLSFLRRKDPFGFLRYLSVTTLLWLFINIPFILTTPRGWWRFFELNINRGTDFGSLWYAFELFGLHLSHTNYLSLTLFIVGSGFLVWCALRNKNEIPLSSLAFFAIVLFTSASKVYSPQYVLWLAPIAILAIPRCKVFRAHEWALFWVWQGSELIYHLAIWQYLASYTGAHFGLPARAYALATVARWICAGWLAIRLLLSSTPRPITQEESLDFSVVEGKGYA